MLVSALKKYIARDPLSLTNHKAGSEFKSCVNQDPASTVESFNDGRKQENTTQEGTNSFSSTKLFNITFTYQKRVIHMKVLKVFYYSGEVIYKLPLDSTLSQRTQICWLQYNLPSWKIILGYDLDEKLTDAISSAIEILDIKTISNY